MNYLITGTGSGIGFQTALALAEEPLSKVVCISRSKVNLEKLKETALLQKRPGEILPLSFDLTDFSPVTVHDFLKLHKIEHIDGLVNNAGHLINKPFEQLTTDDFKMVYEVNVFAAVKLIQALLPFLKKSKNPHIINIGSLGGFQGSSKFRGLSAYSSSKAALACLSECLAIEFAEDKIAVNALALGSVNTEMLAKAFPGFQAPVSSEEMGKYIADFVLNGHHYYNGKILPVALSGQ